jgi:AraC-like DNA-binding protein
LRNLLSLHRAASRAAESKSGLLINPAAAHGLEQQLIDALVECLSARPPEVETSTQRRHRDLLARFEDVLSAEPALGIRKICAVLGTSASTLHECTLERLGMSPGRYRRLRLTVNLTSDRGSSRSQPRVSPE